MNGLPRGHKDEFISAAKKTLEIAESVRNFSEEVVMLAEEKLESVMEKAPSPPLSDVAEYQYPPLFEALSNELREINGNLRQISSFLERTQTKI